MGIYSVSAEVTIGITLTISADSPDDANQAVMDMSADELKRRCRYEDIDVMSWDVKQISPTGDKP